MKNEKELLEKKKELFFYRLKQTKMVGNPYGSQDYYGYNQITYKELERYLSNTSVYSEELVRVSRELYNMSATYNKIINFYATLPTFSYVVDLGEVIEKEEIEEVRKEYEQVLEQLEKMQLRHELYKILKIGFKEDIFYGYEIETDDSYYILRLPPEHCKITGVEDGVYTIAYDFSSIMGNKEIDNLPKEMRAKYHRAKRNGMGTGYIELDSKNAFAFKINEELPYPLPPFASSMLSAIEEQDYKKLKKSKDKMDNHMSLVQKIPIDEKQAGIDQFKVSIDTAMQFHELIADVLPEEIGIITTPMDIESIKLEKTKREDDIAMESKDNTMSDAGLPPNIFSSTNKTASGIKFAIQYLEQIVYAPLRQMERWLNRKIKFENYKYKFKVRLLDVTHFSKDDAHKRYLQSAQFGFPTRQEVASVMDISPLSFSNKLIMENDILSLQERMEPLASTHTQSSNDKTSPAGDSAGGREEKDEKEVAESTEVWRENRIDE